MPKVDESTLLKCNSQTKLDFITSVDPKESLIKKHKMDLNIKQLTNTEDIVDFYEFLHECLNKIKLIENLSILKKLRLLNLANNQITNFTDLLNNRSLEELNLRKNLVR